MQSQFDRNKDYRPVLKYINGIAKKFSWTYSKEGLTVEDLAQECYIKLLYLQDKDKLKEALSSGEVFKDKKGKTKIIYPLLGTILKHHLIDKVRKLKDDPLYGAVSLDSMDPETAEFTGEPMPIKNTNTDYKEPKKVKKLEGRPYIPIKTLNAPKLLFYEFFNSKSIIHLGDGYIQVANKSFEDDLVDRMLLIDYAREVISNLDKFDQKIFLCELIYGHFKKRNYKDIADRLNTYSNKIKRHMPKIYDIKGDQVYKINKEIIKTDFRDNPEEQAYRLKELEYTRKAFKTGEPQAYFTGRHKNI